MGLLDQVLGKAGGVGGGTGGDMSGLIQAVLGMLAGGGQGGGLQALIQAFQGQGMEELVSSWVGTGENLPVTAEQMKRGLGPDFLSQLSSRSGMSPDDAASGLAGVLPGLIDKLTPDGKVPDLGRLQQEMGFLDDILSKG